MNIRIASFNNTIMSPTVWIGLFATLAVIAWFLTQHIGFTSDSVTYWLFNEYLLRKQGPGSFLFFRTPGYPLLMILSGVSYFHSFIGLLFIQAIMAILMPILIYKTLILGCASSRFLWSDRVDFKFIASSVLQNNHDRACIYLYHDLTHLSNT